MEVDKERQQSITQYWAKHVPACFQRLTVFLRPPSLLDDPRESGTSPCLQQADCLLIWRIEARTQTLRFIRQQERINNVTGLVHVDRWCIRFLHRQYTPSLLWNRTGTRSQQERILSLSPRRSRLLNLMRLQMQTSSMFQDLKLYSKEHTSGFLYEVTVFSRSVKMFSRDRLRSANWIEKVYIYAQQRNLLWYCWKLQTFLIAYYHHPLRNSRKSQKNAQIESSNYVHTINHSERAKIRTFCPASTGSLDQR
jgi:hypothetical protein